MTRLPVEVRRRALVNAAIRVIARDGVPAATTRAIVAEAKMSLASFHYAFESRDQLLETVIAQVIADEHAAAEAAYLPVALASGAPHGSAPSTMEATVRAGLDSYLELLIADPGREQAMIELSMHALRTPGANAVVAAQYASYLDIAELALVTAATATRHRWTVPTRQVARLLITYTDGLTTTWLVDRDTTAARESNAHAAQAIALMAEPVGSELPTLTTTSIPNHREEPSRAH